MTTGVQVRTHAANHDVGMLDGKPLAHQETLLLVVDSLLPADSPRLDGEDSHHVRLLAESDTALPPILVHRQSMRVIDGMHRLRAAKMRGQRAIPAIFFDGDDNDAFVIAVAANRAHGLPLTLADRSAAAARIIEAQPHRSDRSIAAITGLAARTIGEIRRRTGGDAWQPQARVGQDGRVRPLNAAEGRRAASAVIDRRPEASLREIARLAGISLATARDVRERLRRGEDPLPPKQRENPLGKQRDELEQQATVVRLHRNGNGRSNAHTAAGSDRTEMLRNLRSDPSLRFNESGRNLLRWLHIHAKGPADWEDVVDDIPSHCAYVLVDLARACAEEWSAFASNLQQRFISSE